MLEKVNKLFSHYFQVIVKKDFSDLNQKNIFLKRWANLPRNGGVAFGPFGTGPRLCLGQQLALVEASYVTIRLLQTFSQLDSNHTECRRLVGATMRLMDGCQVTLK